jgi:hypothetical protein
MNIKKICLLITLITFFSVSIHDFVYAKNDKLLYSPTINIKTSFDTDNKEQIIEDIIAILVNSGNDRTSTVEFLNNYLQNNNSNKNNLKITKINEMEYRIDIEKNGKIITKTINLPYLSEELKINNFLDEFYNEKKDNQYEIPNKIEDILNNIKDPNLLVELVNERNEKQKTELSPKPLNIEKLSDKKYKVEFSIQNTRTIFSAFIQKEENKWKASKIGVQGGQNDADTVTSILKLLQYIPKDAPVEINPDYFGQEVIEIKINNNGQPLRAENIRKEILKRYNLEQKEISVTRYYSYDDEGTIVIRKSAYSKIINSQNADKKNEEKSDEKIRKGVDIEINKNSLKKDNLNYTVIHCDENKFSKLDIENKKTKLIEMMKGSKVFICYPKIDVNWKFKDNQEYTINLIDKDGKLVKQEGKDEYSLVTVERRESDSKTTKKNNINVRIVNLGTHNNPEDVYLIDLQNAENFEKLDYKKQAEIMYEMLELINKYIENPSQKTIGLFTYEQGKYFSDLLLEFSEYHDKIKSNPNEQIDFEKIPNQALKYYVEKYQEMQITINKIKKFNDNNDFKATQKWDWSKVSDMPEELKKTEFIGQHPEFPENKIVYLPYDPETEYMIASDFHGNFQEEHSFEKVVKEFKEKKARGEKVVLILLGDYVDRGEDSGNIIKEIIDLVEAYKDSVIVLRGNHEDSTREAEGFLMGRLNFGITSYFDEQIAKFYKSLPLVCVIGDKVVAMHGGVPIKVEKVMETENNYQGVSTFKVSIVTSIKDWLSGNYDTKVKNEKDIFSYLAQDIVSGLEDLKDTSNSVQITWIGKYDYLNNEEGLYRYLEKMFSDNVLVIHGHNHNNQITIRGKENNETMQINKANIISVCSGLLNPERGSDYLLLPKGNVLNANFKKISEIKFSKTDLLRKKIEDIIKNLLEEKFMVNLKNRVYDIAGMFINLFKFENILENMISLNKLQLTQELETDKYKKFLQAI